MRADTGENYDSLTSQFLSLMSRIKQKPNIKGNETVSGVFSLAVFEGHFPYLLHNSGKPWGESAEKPLGVCWVWGAMNARAGPNPFPQRQEGYIARFAFLAI